MVELLERVELTIDGTGKIILPKEVQESLEPGIVFVVETRHNGTIVLRIERQPSMMQRQDISSAKPKLIEKNGLLVVRGEVQKQFNWDLLLEERESPLHAWEPTAQ